MTTTFPLMLLFMILTPVSELPQSISDLANGVGVSNRFIQKMIPSLERQKETYQFL